MILINKDSLRFTKVCPVDDPKHEQLAVLAKDINDGIVYEVVKSKKGLNMPIDAPVKTESTSNKMPLEDALIVGRSMKMGLSKVEQEAIDVLCDYIENQNNK